MGRVNFTEDQQKVIDLRDCNILVSAAAGSGKTAVLVERIMKKISEGRTPVDIDRLLIVTFTDAAAGEMRERISRAIEKKRQEEPENTHLERQASLVHNAQITTIHSFCMNILRNYFNDIDLDPGFRLGDETELKILKADVLEEVLEDFYTEKKPDFVALVESYATGKRDESISRLVLRFFEFAMSYPWPQKWITAQKNNFLVENEEQFLETAWQKELLEFLKTQIRDCLEENRLARQIAEESDGPYMYEPALEGDRQQLEQLLRAENYREIGEVLETTGWARLSGKKDEGVNPDKRELVKLLRESTKKAVSGIREKYYFQPLEDMIEDIRQTAPAMNALIELTLAFMEAYEEKKRERNLLDFNDLEHFALKILVKEPTEAENGWWQPEPSETAVELSRYYDEILIDEYQDSNLVQETLLNSISREKFGQPNVFMVGDVKQSIYKFRLARPELFMEKFDTYGEEGAYVKVDLKKNFRSRESVLGAVNYIFFGIMKKDLGNIAYDGEAALYPGRPEEEESPEEKKLWQDCEILLAPSSGEVTDKELEGKIIAARIKKLRQEKNLPYKEMVILLRSMKGWSEELTRILKEEGIPARAAVQTGYFSAVEVTTILNFLLIIDNPRQDIPLAAVLRSSIGGFSDEELAALRQVAPEGELYDCVTRLNEDLTKDRKKTEKFLGLLEELRSMVPLLSIYELLCIIYKKTGYYDYVKALPGGAVRCANLDMLLKKSADFEGSSYGGLFQFNRYIEKLHEYEVDFGEAEAAGDLQDTVTIMSIHKSKGLEFSVVFLAGMGKSFNKQDSRERLLLHPDLGIGPDWVDSTMRTKVPTLLKQVIKRKTDLENMGEELRVLYVAMTRAREKLILTGCLKDIEKTEAKWRQWEPMLFSQRAGAGCYLDFIMPRVFLWEKDKERAAKDFPEACENFSYQTTYITEENLVFEQVLSHIGQGHQKEDVLALEQGEYWSQEERQRIERCLNYSYLYEKERTIKSKLTVSELKYLTAEEKEETGELLNHRKEEEAYIPGFAREEAVLTGSQRGTLYHRVMEAMSFVRAQKQGILKELEYLEETGRISGEEKTMVHRGKLEALLTSSLGLRIQQAEKRGQLYREQPFVMGLPARELQAETESEENVLVQGVIDCFFEEPDGLVLVDYKTDRIEETKELIHRYKTQMEYYKKALERVMGKEVKECLLYSFYLQETIDIFSPHRAQKAKRVDFFRE